MTVYAGYGVATLADLKAIAPGDRCNLMALAVQEKKAFYQFNATATDTPDEILIVAPNEGEGRWFALGAPGSGGSSGGGGGVLVQSGKPTTTPTAIGVMVADSRSDRGVLWISVGTASPDDWEAFGYRPIVVSESSVHNGYPFPDFIGQTLVVRGSSSSGTILVCVDLNSYNSNNSWRATTYYDGGS